MSVSVRERLFHASETVLDDRRAEENQNDASASLIAPDVLAHWIPVLIDELGNIPMSERKFLFIVTVTGSFSISDFTGASSGPACTPLPKEICGNEGDHPMNPEHVHLLATK